MSSIAVPSNLLEADSSLARQSYQKLRAACRQRALSFLSCCAGMTLTGGSVKNVGDSCWR